VAGETWADIRIEYGDNAVARFDEDSRISPDKTCVRFRFTGSRGAISGTLGIYYDYPFGRADTLRLIPSGWTEETVPERQLPGRWVPDAFSETMRALFVAIDTDSLPQNSGPDHLETLRLIDSIYAASEIEMLPHRSER
jgi:predicted dehydrogenase